MLTFIDPHPDPFAPPFTPRRPLHVAFSRDHPAIPALPETLLRLDLMVQQRCIDLRAVTDLILSDIGATLQVLRLAARELRSDEQRQARIEEYISDVGLDACRHAIAALTAPVNGWQPALVEFWAHSRSTAQYCKLIAENVTGVNPDRAYLIGLLHSMGSLPLLLGWKDAGVTDSALTGLHLARRWSLPYFVVEYFNEVHRETCVTPWSSVVRKAHAASSNASAYCFVRPATSARTSRQPAMMGVVWPL